MLRLLELMFQMQHLVLQPQSMRWALLLLVDFAFNSLRCYDAHSSSSCTVPGFCQDCSTQRSHSVCRNWYSFLTAKGFHLTCCSWPAVLRHTLATAAAQAAPCLLKSKEAQQLVACDQLNAATSDNTFDEHVCYTNMLLAAYPFAICMLSSGPNLSQHSRYISLATTAAAQGKACNVQVAWSLNYSTPCIKTSRQSPTLQHLCECNVPSLVSIHLLRQPAVADSIQLFVVQICMTKFINHGAYSQSAGVGNKPSPLTGM